MSRLDSTADDNDVGDSNLLHFGSGATHSRARPGDAFACTTQGLYNPCLRFVLSSVAAHGDGASVEFLMTHEVVALLETVASKREGTGDDAGRMRAVLDFCKDRTHCTELGPQNLQSFCRSVRGKLQTMTDLLDDEVRFCANSLRSNTSYGVARECRRVQHVRTNSLHYA